MLANVTVCDVDEQNRNVTDGERGPRYEDDGSKQGKTDETAQTKEQG